MGRPEPAALIRPGPRLRFKPRPATAITATPGSQPLGLGDGRDGALYVPRGYRPDSPTPLVLALHGATGSSEGPVRNFGPVADQLGIALLVPDSRLPTWDAIAAGEFSVDRDFIDRSLELAASRISIDPNRIGIAGFSDGATYAIGLGRANTHLFKGIAAFSPGFLIDVIPNGRAPVFISHGTHDPILPIDNCSRRIVPALRSLGYKVTYQEFEGGHTVPSDAAATGYRIAAAIS